MSFITAIFIVGFAVLAIGFVVWDQGRRRETLGQVWWQLAAHAGLIFHGLELDLWGSSRSPAVSGAYRGRQVRVSRIVQQIDASEGSVPAVYTRMSLEVNNAAGCRLSLGSASFLERIFGRDRTRSGDKEFDHRFRVSGDPATFAQKAVEVLASHVDLFARPAGVIQRTDCAWSWVSWSPPSIQLKGPELTCTQSGVPTYIPHQVALLNLLCDLAELAERAGV